jgi:hypothetical protein
MRVFVGRSLFFIGAFALLSATPLYARDTMVFKIPFNFELRGQEFPSGQYVITNVGDSVMSINGRNGRAFAFFLTEPISGQDPEGQKPTLVFVRHEKQIELSKIWESGTEGRELPRR